MLTAADASFPLPPPAPPLPSLSPFPAPIHPLCLHPHPLTSHSAPTLTPPQTSAKIQQWFTGYVCHELRNPLHILKANVQEILASWASAARTQATDSVSTAVATNTGGGCSFAGVLVRSVGAGAATPHGVCPSCQSPASLRMPVGRVGLTPLGRSPTPGPGVGGARTPTAMTTVPVRRQGRWGMMICVGTALVARTPPRHFA